MFLPFLALIATVACLCTPSPPPLPTAPFVQILSLIIFCLIQEAIFAPLLGLLI